MCDGQTDIKTTRAWATMVENKILNVGRAHRLK